MRTTVNIDDELSGKAQKLTGITGKDGDSERKLEGVG